MLIHLLQKVKHVKEWCGENKQDIFAALLVFLAGMGSFGLGRLSAIWPRKEPIMIENVELGRVSGINHVLDNNGGPSESGSLLTNSHRYVASKQGSRYHFTWCPGALTIKEENKIWFDSVEEARAKGYQPAKNCPDLP